MRSLFLALVFVLVTSSAFCATATLNWDSVITNTDGTVCTDLAGYNVYSSATTGGPYTKLLTTSALVTTATVSITVPNNIVITHYYVATAFDTTGNESAFSNEASKSFFGLDTVPPKAPGNMR